MCFQMFMIFSFTKFKVVYGIESLSLKLIQGNGVLYLTVLVLYGQTDCIFVPRGIQVGYIYMLRMKSVKCTLIYYWSWVLKETTLELLLPMK